MVTGLTTQVGGAAPGILRIVCCVGVVPVPIKLLVNRGQMFTLGLLTSFKT